MRGAHTTQTKNFLYRECLKFTVVVIFNYIRTYQWKPSGSFWNSKYFSVPMVKSGGPYYMTVYLEIFPFKTQKGAVFNMALQNRKPYQILFPSEF